MAKDIADTLKRLKEEYDEIGLKIYREAQKNGGELILTKEDYIAIGAARQDEIKEEWSKLSPEVSIEEYNIKEKLWTREH